MFELHRQERSAAAEAASADIGSRIAAVVTPPIAAAAQATVAAAAAAGAYAAAGLRAFGSWYLALASDTGARLAERLSDLRPLSLAADGLAAYWHWVASTADWIQHQLALLRGL
jgi:hypothetical protein